MANRPTRVVLGKIDLSSSTGRSWLAAALSETERYAQIQKVTKKAWPDPLPLLKYTIRARYTRFGGRTLCDLKDAHDKYEPVETWIFSGRFSFSAQVGGFVPMGIRHPKSRWIAEKISAVQQGWIMAAWKKAKRHLVSPSGEEPMLVHTFVDQHVYFMRCAGTGEIKIGISYHPEERRRQVRRERGHETTLLHIVPSGGRKLEQELHRHFQRHRQEGEWFKPVDEILAYIAQLREGSDPVKAMTSSA